MPFWAAILAIMAPASSIAGIYQSQQMEVGAALELKPDGHFRYQLDYGAVSEHAEGDWTFDGLKVRLTTKPAPRAPTFELVRDDPAPLGKVSLILAPPGIGDGYRLDGIATDSLGRRGRVATDDKGLVEADGHQLVAIDPLVPIYGTVGGHFPLTSGRGHRLLLRFRPNDLGTAAFEREPLDEVSGALVLNRYDTQIRFLKVRP